MGQGLFVVEHRAKVAHVEPAAARLTFPKMLGIAQRRAANLLARFSRAKLSALCAQS
jgi:hypothetical protein